MNSADSTIKKWSERGHNEAGVYETCGRVCRIRWADLAGAVRQPGRSHGLSESRVSVKVSQSAPGAGSAQLHRLLRRLFGDKSARCQRDASSPCDGYSIPRLAPRRYG